VRLRINAGAGLRGDTLVGRGAVGPALGSMAAPYIRDLPSRPRPAGECSSVVPLRAMIDDRAKPAVWEAIEFDRRAEPSIPYNKRHILVAGSRPFIANLGGDHGRRAFFIEPIETLQRVVRQPWTACSGPGNYNLRHE